MLRSIARIAFGLAIGIIALPVIVSLCVAFFSGFAAAAGMLIAFFFAFLGILILKVAGALILIGILLFITARHKK